MRPQIDAGEAFVGVAMHLPGTVLKRACRRFWRVSE